LLVLSGGHAELVSAPHALSLRAISKLGIGRRHVDYLSVGYLSAGYPYDGVPKQVRHDDKEVFY
jgi:hypothetical protein